MARTLDSTFQTSESDLKGAREVAFAWLGVCNAYPDETDVGDRADSVGRSA
jgi:hypothetical protein